MGVSVKFLFLGALFLITISAIAGLPPTSSKGIGDTGNITTFNFQFPEFTVTHTAVSTQFTLPSIVTNGVCTNCNLSILPDGRVWGYSNGSGGGGSAPVIQVKTGNYNVQSTDTDVEFVVTQTATAFLPTCSGAGSEWKIAIDNMGSTGNVSISPSGSDTITNGPLSGLSSYSLTDPGASVTVKCNIGSTIYVTQ